MEIGVVEGLVALGLLVLGQWGGPKLALNGTKQMVKNTNKKVDEIHGVVTDPEHGNIALDHRVRHLEE